ncbi:MFS transporter [Actinomadura verrucosospora]|uniref:Membrane transporter n=1 Tax=Actinomadura verrucosospora TaxID=46165 RepID=A0A7D3VQN4_ACTVE|nr:MFS transporter [Actinomadura verrucosospora]QKG19970.1 membrane transporter [Actinomadura verrucosospora]
MPVKPTLVSVLKDPAVAPLFIARATSATGNGFGRVALAWGALHLGYGPGGLSLVLACQALPQLLLVLVGGLIGDRVRRQYVLVGADALAAATWTMLAVCFTGRSVSPAVVAPLAVLTGVATAMFTPVAEGIVTDLVHHERRFAANALLRQSTSTGLIIGLALSGMVVAAVGPATGAALNAASFAASAALLTRLRIPGRDRAAGSLVSELRDGWREFTGRPWLWVLSLQYTAVTAASAAYVGVIGPLYVAAGNGGSRAWGIMAGCQSLGMVLAGGPAARLRPARPILVAVLMTAPAATPMLLMGLGASWTVLAVVMLTAGMCQTTFGVLWSSAVQDDVPAEAMSRVASWDLLGALALAPLGLLVAGPIASAVGVERAAAGAALLILGATSAAVMSPHVRRFRPDSQNDQGPAETVEALPASRRPRTRRPAN